MLTYLDWLTGCVFLLVEVISPPSKYFTVINDWGHMRWDETHRNVSVPYTGVGSHSLIQSVHAVKINFAAKMSHPLWLHMVDGRHSSIVSK